jgi:hypothetical protein
VAFAHLLRHHGATANEYCPSFIDRGAPFLNGCRYIARAAKLRKAS